VEEEPRVRVVGKAWRSCCRVHADVE
jgi:hypothetical protein